MLIESQERKSQKGHMSAQGISILDPTLNVLLHHSGSLSCQGNTVEKSIGFWM